MDSVSGDDPKVMLWACAPILIYLLAWVFFSDALRRRFPSVVCSTAAGAAISFVGMTAALAVVAMLLSLFGAITSTAYRIVLPVFLAAAVTSWWPVRKRSPRTRWTLAGAAPLGLAALVLLVLLVWVLVCPPYVWDSLAYHLPMTATYLQQHSLELFATQNPRQITSPHCAELTTLAFMAFSGNDICAQFIGWLGLAATLFAVHAAVAPHGGASASRLSSAGMAVLFVLTAPQILGTAASAKSDLMGCALIAISVWAVCEAVRRAPNTERHVFYAALAGFAAALAVATKVLGLNAGMGLLAMIGMCAIRGSWDWRRSWVFVLSMAAPLLLFVLPHSIRSYRAYGTILGMDLTHAAELQEGGWAAKGGLLVDNLHRMAEVYFRPVTRFGHMPNNEVSDLGFGVMLAAPLILGFVLLRSTRRLRRFWKVPGWEFLAFLATFGALLLSARRHEEYALARYAIPMAPVMAIFLFASPPWRCLRRPLSLVVGLATGGIALWLMVLAFITPYGLGHLRWTLERGFPPSCGESLGHLGAAQGYGVLERFARPNDRVLFLGAVESIMYPCFSQRLNRTVWGISGVEDLKTKAALRPEWIVIEENSSPELKHEAKAIALAKGYHCAFKGPFRSIYARDLPGKRLEGWQHTPP